MNAIAKTSSLVLLTTATAPFVAFVIVLASMSFDAGCKSEKGGVDAGNLGAPMIAPVTPGTTADTATASVANTATGATPLGATPLGATPLANNRPVTKPTVVKFVDGGLAQVPPGATVPPNVTVMPNAPIVPGMPTIFPTALPSGLAIPTALPSGIAIPTAFPSGLAIPTALPSGLPPIPTNLQLPTAPPQN